MQAPRSRMISYSRVTHTGKLLTGQMVLCFAVKRLHGFLFFFYFIFFQNLAAPKHPPVPGTVCRGHPHPAGL